MPFSRPLARTAARAALLAAACLAPRPAAAHAPGDALLLCSRGRITEIFVDNNSVFDVSSASSGRASRFLWAFRLANRLHVRTREQVIRRELLFREGDCYDPALLEDSERILRAAPFIADADVFGIAQPDGTYHVVVQTRDEWSTRLEAQVEGGAELSGLQLREDNLLGTGQHVSGSVWETHGEREVQAAYGTTQLLGTHVNADVSVGRNRVGTSATERLAYPFRGETGRFAVLQQISLERDYFEYLGRQADGRQVQYLYPQNRRSFDVGGVVRLGHRGNLSLFGVGLSGEWIDYPAGVVVRGPDGTRTTMASDSGVLRLDSISNVRVVFLAGQRNVRFDRRRALDAVRGVEDVRLGGEVELGVGRSLTAFSSDDDLALSLGMSVATDLPGGIFAGGRMVVQGRRDNDAPPDATEWRDVFSQLDAWAYWRPSEESHHTIVAAAEAAGGWHTDVPFQLTLGSAAGLRGYGRHEFTGQRRVVATLEDRAYLAWPYPQLFDLGTAVFVDAGRSWAAGDPFGENSGIEVSAGAGLRVAFPPNSRRTYRLDVAMPVRGGHGVTVTLGVGQAVGRGAVEDDPQIRRSARRMLSPSVFSFPN